MDALYQKALLGLAQKSRESKYIEHPTHTASLNNPVCGDRVNLAIQLKDGYIHALSAKAKGCALCEAGTGLWLEIGEGCHVDEMQSMHDNVQTWLAAEAQPLPFAQAEPLIPIQNIKNRHKCVLLALKAATHFKPV